MKRNLMCALLALGWGIALAAGPDHGVLHRGNGLEPETLDPHKARGDAAFNILRDLYEGLVTTGPDGTLEPGQAESWEVSADGRVYTFRLRATARWSNGEPLTAEDFVFAFRRLVDPATASPYAQALAPIENAAAIVAGRAPPASLAVTALDARTLRITLGAPAPYFLSLLTHPSTYPVHRPSLARHGERFTRPGIHVSNGAYLLKEWVVQSHITLVANPQYRAADEVRIREVRYYAVDDENAEFQRYRAGELDITYTIPHRQFALVRKELAAEARIAPFLATYFYGFNLTRPPFRDNLALRQALSLALDRDTLVEKVTGAGEIAAWGWVPPGVANYRAQRFEYADWPKAKRLEEARRLYRAAGYGPQRPLKVELRFNTGDNHRRVALAVAAMWKEALGVETVLVSEEWQVFLQNRQQMQVTQVYRSGWNGDYNDAFSFAELLGSQHPINDFGYRNPAYDALLARIARTVDPAARRALLEEAERMVLHDHPFLPLYFYVSKHLVKPRVRGWTDNVMDIHLTRHLALAAP